MYIAPPLPSTDTVSSDCDGDGDDNKDTIAALGVFLAIFMASTIGLSIQLYRVTSYSYKGTVNSRSENLIPTSATSSAV